MKKLYSIRETKTGRSFECNFCPFKTRRQGDMLRHHNPNSPERCKKRNWDSTQKDIEKVIYLAAGVGQRLRPLTYSMPKCLIKFGDKTLLEHSLDTFVENNIKEVVIVVGHFANTIKKKVGKKYRGIKIKYIYNPFYEATGGAHSLWLARDEFRGRRCLIMDGDHLIDGTLINNLINSEYKNCLLVDNLAELELGEETVVLGNEGIINLLAWSPAGDLSKMINRSECVGEAIIIIKLSPKGSRILADELDWYVKAGGSGRLEIIEPLNRLIQRCDVWYINTENLPWIEIDFPRDLERATNEIYPAIVKRMGKKR